MNSSRRFSRWSLLPLVLAAIAFARAEIAFRDGLAWAGTNLPYYEAVSSLMPGPSRPPGMWAGPSVTETHLAIGLTLFALLSALSAVGLAICARRRAEPPVAYAGVVVLSIGIALLAARLLGWLWPAYLAL